MADVPTTADLARAKTNLDSYNAALENGANEPATLLLANGQLPKTRGQIEAVAAAQVAAAEASAASAADDAGIANAAALVALENANIDHWTNSWSELSVITVVDGERAYVPVTDTGTHSAASGTGYNGATVDNEGVYVGNGSWGRWVRERGTGMAGRITAAEARAIVRGVGLEETVFGCAATPESGDTSGTFTRVLDGASQDNQWLETLEAYGTSSGTLRIAAWTKSGDDFDIVGGWVSLPVVAGLNTYSTADFGELKLAPGQYLGFGDAGRISSKTSFSGAATPFFATGSSNQATSFTDSTVSSTQQIQLRATFRAAGFGDDQFEPAPRNTLKGRGSAPGAPANLLPAEVLSMLGLSAVLSDLRNAVSDGAGLPTSRIDIPGVAQIYEVENEDWDIVFVGRTNKPLFGYGGGQFIDGGEA